jgi:transcriptional regulator with XRE-family HTH domain
MAKTLGNRIRELREGGDLSLREFARKLGDVSAAHVSDIELGRRFPSDDLLAKMAFVLGVPFAELKSYDPRPPVEDLKRIAEADPAFGFALRKLVDKKVSAEEIIELAKTKPNREKPE